MSGGLIGTLIGLVIAVVDFALLRMLSARVELHDTKRVLSVTGIAQLVLFPVVGFFVGPYVFGD